MQFNLESIIITLSSAYLVIRIAQETYRFLKNRYIQDYILLKQINQYKGNPEVYFYHLFHYAQKLMNEKKLNKAAEHLETILQGDPNYPLANYLMGIVLFQKNQYSQAQTHLLRETDLIPDHPMVYFFSAKCLLELGQHVEALNTLEKSLQLNPYYYPAYILGMEIFCKLHVEPREEWQFLHRAEEARCLILPLWLRMAELEKSFLSEEERGEREKVYQELDKAWREGSELKEKVIKALNEQQPFRAENLIIEGLQLNPNDNQLYQIYDQILVMQKKFPAALRFYEEARQRINPNPLESCLRLTDYLVYNKEYQRALDIMLNILKTYSNAKFLHYPLCIIYNWLERPTDALFHLAKAIYFDKNVGKMAANNPELENLREHEEFQRLVQQ